MPRRDPFTKWELIILRSAALILLVIAVFQLIVPEIARIIKEIVDCFH